MISVAMCTYNGANFIAKQLQSIIIQSLPPDEIIICDDRSSDSTVSICQEILSDWSGQWHIEVNEKNLGFKKNFEKAIQICHGDIIFLSDQDDVWMPNKIEKVNAVFEAHSEVVLVFHDAEIVDQDLNCLETSFWESLNFCPAWFLQHDYFCLFRNNVVQGSASAFRRELVSCACPFPEGSFHDEWLAMSALTMGEIFPVEERLLKYRQWGDNAVGGAQPSVKMKFIKWTKNIRSAARKHREYIRYKKQINQVWEQRYLMPKTKLTPNAWKVMDFTKIRADSLMNRNLAALKKLPMYFGIYLTYNRAIREIAKDVLALIVR